MSGPTPLPVPEPWRAAVDGFTAWLAAARPATTVYLRRHHVARLARDHPDRGPWSLGTDELAAWLAAHQWGVETRRSHRSSLRVFYRWAVRTGRVERDPAADLATLAPTRPAPRPAADGAVSSALDRAGPREALMLALARFAGLRRGEIARCHTEDLHEDPAGYSLRVRGKGGRVRVVPLPGWLGQQLTQHHGWVFPSPASGHLTPEHVGRLMSRALGTAGSAHQLRHGFATSAYATDRDIRAVQELLGHASVATTQVYTAAPDAALRAAMEGAGWHLRGARS